jgi:hypothetical protein
LEEFEEGIDSDELIQQWKTRQNEMLLKRKEKNEILKSLGFCVESVEGDAY